jgi:hypothetical protein
MTFNENLKRKENGIIFAPNYGDFTLNIKCANVNIALFNRNNPNFMKWFTNGGIEIA